MCVCKLAIEFYVDHSRSWPHIGPSRPQHELPAAARESSKSQASSTQHGSQLKRQVHTPPGRLAAQEEKLWAGPGGDGRSSLKALPRPFADLKMMIKALKTLSTACAHVFLNTEGHQSSRKFASKDLLPLHDPVVCHFEAVSRTVCSFDSNSSVRTPHHNTSIVIMSADGQSAAEQLTVLQCSGLLPLADCKRKSLVPSTTVLARSVSLVF